ETAQLGFVMAAGDLDGKPGAELAVSAPGADITVTNSGGVYLYRFTAQGPELLRPALTGLGAGQFGAALAIGDLDGDGDNDLAVGTPAANFAGVNGRGMVDVFLLQPGQAIPDFAEKRFPGLDLDHDGGTRRTANVNAGRGLLLDDVNGDGRADLSFVSR